MHLMRDLRDRHGMTFIFSTHDPRVVAHAVRVGHAGRRTRGARRAEAGRGAARDRARHRQGAGLARRGDRSCGAARSRLRHVALGRLRRRGPARLRPTPPGDRARRACATRSRQRARVARCPDDPALFPDRRRRAGFWRAAGRADRARGDSGRRSSWRSSSACACSRPPRRASARGVLPAEAAAPYRIRQLDWRSPRRITPSGGPRSIGRPFTRAAGARDAHARTAGDRLGPRRAVRRRRPVLAVHAARGGPRVAARRRRGARRHRSSPTACRSMSSPRSAPTSTIRCSRPGSAATPARRTSSWSAAGARATCSAA